MTLEQQVHEHEVIIRRLTDRIRRLERIVEKLEKDSHPPIDFIERIAEAINKRELKLAGSTDTGQKIYVDVALIKGNNRG